MKCLVLAAGYATRMYPLTKDFPKPLLPIKEKPLIEYLLEDMEQIQEITEYLIVTNQRFYIAFEEWKKTLTYNDKIKLINDGSTDNENRLGAVEDIALVIEKEKISDDLLIVAGDNLLDFSLRGFVDEFRKRNNNLVMYYRETNWEKLKKTGVAKLAPDGLILSMEEKPEEPKGDCAIPPFYILKKEKLPYIREGIKAGCNVDSPGSFLAWFCQTFSVYAIAMPGKRYDIGSLDTYYKLQKLWGIERVLVTGAAGFIGAALCMSLLQDGCTVVGLDNMNSYYSVKLKLSRLKELKSYPNFIFLKGDLADKEFVENTFEQFSPDIVVNLAAQAGVRYSIQNPQAYMDSNIIGFFHVLEAIRKSREDGRKPVKHFIFASSSSIYGLQEKIPYSTQDKTDEPVSFYAATKKSNELMAHAYSKIYGIPSTGLRFFTVYGPKGRPDMAYFSFTEKILRGEPVTLYNNGNMYRDFTYIDDIIEGVRKIINHIPQSNGVGAPFKVFNIGNSRPESLEYFIDTLEQVLTKEGLLKDSVKKQYLPMQLGDVYQTYADMEEIENKINFCPKTQLEEGLEKFVKWYKDYKEI